MEFPQPLWACWPATMADFYSSSHSFPTPGTDRLSIIRDVCTEGHTRTQKCTSQNCSHQQFTVGQRTHRDSETQGLPQPSPAESPPLQERHEKQGQTSRG